MKCWSNHGKWRGKSVRICLWWLAGSSGKASTTSTDFRTWRIHKHSQMLSMRCFCPRPQKPARSTPHLWYDVGLHYDYRDRKFFRFCWRHSTNSMVIFGRQVPHDSWNTFDPVAKILSSCSLDPTDTILMDRTDRILWTTKSFCLSSPQRMIVG